MRTFLTDNQLNSLCDTLTRKDLKAFDCKEFKDMSYDPRKVIYYTPGDKKGKNSTDKAFIYIRRSPDSKVLAVAHTDIVRQAKMPTPEVTFNRRWVRSRALDDRLGVWLLLHFLPTVLPDDLPYDILLTDFEETGKSTAQWFQPKAGIEYNWMFEWDRHGDDTVMYSYETPTLRELLERFHFKVGTGSFSDICYLSHLNCAGFNFGVGYHNEHSDECYADLKTTFDQVAKFVPFYSDWYHKALKHNHEAAERAKKQKTTPWTSGNSNRGVIGYHANQHTNNYKPLPLVDDSKKKTSITTSTLIEKLAKGEALICTDIRDMNDEEYAIYCQHGNVETLTGNSNAAIEEAIAMEAEIRFKKELVRKGQWTDQQYRGWIHSVMKTQLHGDYTPIRYTILDKKDSSSIITTESSTCRKDKNSKKKESVISWDALTEDQWREARENTLSGEIYQQYLESKDSNMSFEDYCKSLAISSAGSIADTYDPSDSYFRHQAEEFDRHHSDDSTIVFDEEVDLEPTDSELDALDKTIDTSVIQEEVMKDPLYSSEQFPGGKEARDQFLYPSDLT